MFAAIWIQITPVTNTERCPCCGTVLTSEKYKLETRLVYK